MVKFSLKSLFYVVTIVTLITFATVKIVDHAQYSRLIFATEQQILQLSQSPENDLWLTVPELTLIKDQIAISPELKGSDKERLTNLIDIHLKPMQEILDRRLTEKESHNR